MKNIRNLLILFALALLLAACSGGGGGGGFFLPSGGSKSKARHLVSFMTSSAGTGNLSTWPGAGGKAGLAAADAICRSSAAAAGLTGTFKAWISSSTDDAYCRIHNLTGKISDNCGGQASLPVAAGPWVRTDGFPFAASISESLIFTGKIYTPLVLNEYGNQVPAGTRAFTNTAFNGSATSDSNTCSDWESSASAVVGAGFSNMTTVGWTAGWQTTNCSNNNPLICLEVGSGPALDIADYATAGNKAFISSVTGSGNLGNWADAGGNTGIDAGDAICQARAAAAGLANPTHFKAWLSTDTIDAVSRLTSDGPWVRVDGVKIADSKIDLTDGTLFTSLNVTETGQYINDQPAWAGTGSDGLYSGATCSNWTSGSNSLNGGAAAAAQVGGGYSWSNFYAPNCNSDWIRLLCFED